ncbi:alpha/beta hydrolase family esterase [Solimonas sp. K1W22B-7]|uniref:alpha/beta hydrolase family esterase n=1 Tax=Solimonas sp. K1W22B-7 TaxID=2303331 RepID=UPI0013C46468|nr:PHB depolymerase family esterase [Solimonas sp. K1W22B-7]
MRRISAALLACCTAFMPGAASADLDLGAIIGGWSGGLGRLGDGLSEGLGRGLGLSLEHLNHKYLYPTEDTESFEETFTYQGRQRTVLFIKPKTASATPAPVVVLLAYNGGTRTDIANMTYAGDLARDLGVWLIVPEGVSKKWNDDPGASNQSVDDVGFLATVIQSSVAKHGLDAKRVYMAGMSNGGFMTSRFACERPNLIAAGASVVASMRQGLNASCNPSRAVPMTFILGTNDLEVNYSRTSAWALLSGPDTLKRWMGIHNCNPAAVVTTAVPDLDPNDKTTTQRLRNDSCASGGAVEMYVINGGGHTWPQARFNKLTLGRTAMDFSGTLAAWDFFEDFKLP